MSKLPVIEIFGPTIQGEGAAIGLKTMFVRTYGCDYACSWCDSSFTWDGSAKADVMLMNTAEILIKLEELGLSRADFVTISGGNPALYGAPVSELITHLHMMNKKVMVETQGSLWQEWFTDVDILTLSPKPPSSAMNTNWDTLDTLIDKLKDVNQLSLKVVVFDDLDYEYAKKVHQRYRHVPFYLQVGNDDVSHQGDISTNLLNKLEALFQKVIHDGDMNEVRVLPQLHTLVWSNKRGK